MDQAIIFGGKYLFLTVPIIFIVAWIQSGKKQKKQLTLALVLAILLAGILDKIAGKLFYDTRPFVTQGIKPLIQHSADNGFPSEHTLFCFTIATIIFFYRRNLGIVALIISTVVGISRAAAHVHSPIDIIGGMFIGAVAGSCGYLAAKKFLSGKTLEKDNS